MFYEMIPQETQTPADHITVLVFTISDLFFRIITDRVKMDFMSKRRNSWQDNCLSVCSN